MIMRRGTFREANRGRPAHSITRTRNFVSAEQCEYSILPRETIARDTADRACVEMMHRDTQNFRIKVGQRESEVARFLTYGGQSCVTDLRRELAMSRLTISRARLPRDIILTKPEQKEICMSKCLKFVKFLTLHAFMISIIAIEDEYLFLQDLIILVVELHGYALVR